MNLPAGLTLHCADCGVVIPADAPRPASGGNCAWVKRNKMGPWHANETLKGQHTAATAAWQWIYHAAIHGPTPDAAAVAYWRQYCKNPKHHFCSSQARTSLTGDQVKEQTSIVLPPAPPASSKEFRAWKVAVARAARVRRDAKFYS